jgi:RNA polymerase II subunit A small phosphatase-like protein
LAILVDFSWISRILGIFQWFLGFDSGFYKFTKISAKSNKISIISGANPDENLKHSKSNIWESIFCCFRRHNRHHLSSRRSKSNQNGSSPNEGGTSQSQNACPSACIGGVSGVNNRFLLPQVRHSDMHKKCMVIDLDETLVHSSFKVSFFFHYH